jgi:GT2 family glycosyltransferase
MFANAVAESQVEIEFARRVSMSSDINEHLLRLRTLASECEAVTEFGTRTANSTIALLAAQPTKLVSYDLCQHADANIVYSMCGRTTLSLIERNVLDIEIEPTDLLFIDTLHTFKQLSAELALHASKVRRYIVLHDTVTFGMVGEDGLLGLRPAVDQFLNLHNEWNIYEEWPNNNGLMVLARRSTSDAVGISEKMFIGIPILNRIDLLEYCLDSIDYPAEVIVVNNSRNVDFADQLDQLAKWRDVEVLHQQRNLGVAASWNLILRTAFAREWNNVVIGSNDTFLRPGSLRSAAVLAKETGGAVYHLADFNFFVLSRSTIDALGWFDENFYPAYKEDQDCAYRCQLAGVPRLAVPGAGGQHIGSATIRSNAKYERLNRWTHGNCNAAYYASKWGGDAGSETFTRPFNEPARDHRWWPAPDDSIHAHDWDSISE